ncbi:MAG: T9SS type A sorting domain-containing protein [Saprospiraceae bacterium]|nr:T9SS type A sorting domain-containing protein [Saprospiraceae bacterium]
MNKYLLFVLLLCTGGLHFVSAQPPANCSGANTNTLLIAGDSWAQYMYDDGVHNDVFNQYGFADKRSLSSSYEITVSLWGGTSSPDAGDYSVSGSEAREWADEANYNYLQNVRNALIANPSIKTVLLSIGGNDILAARCDGGWYQNMDTNGAGSENTLLNTIMANTTYVVNQILAVRSDITVILSSYDYPNFNTPTSWAGCVWLCNPCEMYACQKRRELSYNSYASPPNDQTTCEGITPSTLITDAGINQMMKIIEQKRQEYVHSTTRVFYDNSLGLMHYFYGDGTSAAGTLPYPQPVYPYTPGGNSNNPSLRENFRLVNVESWFDAPADPIHLSKEGYTYKAKNLMDNYIFSSVLRGTPTTTFFSEGANDGYVYVYNNNSPQSVNTNGIKIGDNGVDWLTRNNEYYGILSFNTSALPDNATVTGASIYMIRSSEDDNPFLKGDRNPILDIKNGNFGSSAGLELADWNASASASNIGCFNGNADYDKYAIRIDLQNTALPQISKTAKTQFRIHFDYADWSPELINFYDGSQTPAINEPPADNLNRKKPVTEEKPLFENYTIKKVANADGTFSEEIVEQSKPIIKQDGYVYEKVKNYSIQQPDGSIMESFTTIAAIEHEGLAKIMGTKAPFIDIWYTVPAPLELIAFDAVEKNSQVYLSWTTVHEFNTKVFVVEHSLDGNSWSSIGEVEPKNSNEVNEYHQLDTKAVRGYNYYRLKIIDIDGTTVYSEVRIIKLGNKQIQTAVYPNPFKDNININLEIKEYQRLKIQLINVLGEIVEQRAVNGVNGTNFFSLDNLNYLPNGTYTLRIEGLQGVELIKLVKN